MEWRQDLRKRVVMDDGGTVVLEALTGWRCRACPAQYLDAAARRRYQEVHSETERGRLLWSSSAVLSLLLGDDDVAWFLCADCGHEIPGDCPASHRGWTGLVCCACYEDAYCPSCNPTW